MAADLDKRSPDASQWGVGSSGVVVGVGTRDSGGGSSARGGATVCSARGGVGTGLEVGAGGVGTRCCQRRGSGRGRATTTVTGTTPGRTDIWGASHLSCSGFGGAGAENTEPRSDSSSRGSGGVSEQRQTRPRSRERRRRERAGRSSSQREQMQTRGGSRELRHRGLNKASKKQLEQGKEEGSMAQSSMRGKVCVGGKGTNNAESDNMEMDPVGGPNARYHAAQSIPAGIDAGGGGRRGHETPAAAPATNVALEETVVANGGAESEMETGHVSYRPATDRLPYKLSVSLIDTYKLINKRYYAEKSRQQQQEQPAADSTSAVAAEDGSSRSGGMSSSGGSDAVVTSSGEKDSRPPARQGGVYNHGLDDENFDYIVHEGEVFHGRYAVKETIGKGSFGKVYRAWDSKEKTDVALKVIKSKRPFTMQARVEVEILELLRDRDPDGKYNCARMLDKFMTHNHQCLVFEILSFNLYELLRSTQFQGVSLHLVRKFARHLLRALAFLVLPQVDVIHCDLKPENILLQHPKRSNIKVIDFGSSCRSNNKMYSYIQSRFYRSPEVMLGLPYTTAIDMWSLGCILVEMHTGDPLFAGVDQFDQMCRIVSVLGMTPTDVVERSPPSHRGQFFEVETSSDEDNDGGIDEGSEGDGDSEERGSPVGPKTRSRRRRGTRACRGRDAAGCSTGGAGSGDCNGRGGRISTSDEDGDQDMADYCRKSGALTPPRRYRLRRHLLMKRARTLGNAPGGGGAAVGTVMGGGVGRNGKRDDSWMIPPRVPLSDVVGMSTGGPQGRREGEVGHDSESYRLFVDLVERMLDHRPETRITPADALLHPFLVDPPPSHVPQQPSPVRKEEHPAESWLAADDSSFVASHGGEACQIHGGCAVYPKTPENGTTIVLPEGSTSERAACFESEQATPGVTRNAGGGGYTVNEGSNRAENDGEGYPSSTTSPLRTRSAPGPRAATGSATSIAEDVETVGTPTAGSTAGTASGETGGDDRSGSGGSGAANIVRPTGDPPPSHRRCRDGTGSSGSIAAARGTSSSAGCGSAGGSSGSSHGGKGSGGSTSCGGGRGGGKGASGSRGRVAGVRKVRSKGPVSGANSDASAKRPGQRRKEAARGAGAGGTLGVDRRSETHTRVGGHQRRRDVAESTSPLLSPGACASKSSVETRRSRAIRRGQSQYSAAAGVAIGVGVEAAGVGVAEGHVEAASAVAQLSLHSSSSVAARDSRHL